jgi:hypothetical protein
LENGSRACWAPSEQGEAVFAHAMQRYRTESERATADLAGHRGVIYDQRNGERLDSGRR